MYVYLILLNALYTKEIAMNGKVYQYKALTKPKFHTEGSNILLIHIFIKNSLNQEKVELEKAVEKHEADVNSEKERLRQMQEDIDKQKVIFSCPVLPLLGFQIGRQTNCLKFSLLSKISERTFQKTCAPLYVEQSRSEISYAATNYRSIFNSTAASSS
jgi:hypothetical protein